MSPQDAISQLRQRMGQSIIGQETYVAARSRHQPTGADNPVHQLTLLAAEAFDPRLFWDRADLQDG